MDSNGTEYNMANWRVGHMVEQDEFNPSSAPRPTGNLAETAEANRGNDIRLPEMPTPLPRFNQRPTTPIAGPRELGRVDLKEQLLLGIPES